MKNYVVAVLMLFAIVGAQAQNDTIKKNNLGQNEVKLNAVFLLFGSIEPSYERNLSEQSSVGISAFILEL